MTEKLTFEQEFKSKLAIQGLSMRKFAEELKIVPQNLSQRVKRGTISYDEALELADKLGYKIEWIKKV